MALKDCNTCGRRYRAKSNRQRYCGTCGRRGGRAECEICGKSFQLVANTSGRLCSRRCWSRSRELARTVDCVTCGKPFVRPSGSKQRACSAECADPLRRLERPNCERCGKPCERRKQRFCSRSCVMRAAAAGRPRRAVGDRAPAGSGYIKLKTASGWQLEHRHLMAQAIGRKLERHERVHHRNGNRADNRIRPGHEHGKCPPECCNLELWRVKAKDPPGVRARDYHCPGCRCHEH